jgi:hypothetical protein
MLTSQKPALKPSAFSNMSTETPELSDPLSAPSLPVPEALTFQPTSSQQGVSKSFDNIPRYLFRLYAPNTAGTTSISNVTSPAWNCGKIEKKRDIFRLPSNEAADLLCKHLNWDTPHQSECNLMSWTSSLLFAVHYAVYRHGHDRQNFDHPELSKIFLLVADTRGFPKGTFVKDLKVIEAFKDYSTGLNQMHKLRATSQYYFGEYLTQGHLDIKERCSQTSIQQMIDLGLFDLYPGLGDKKYWDKWAKSVVAQRSVFQEPRSDAPTEHSDVRKAITIAQGCFGDRWALPVAAMLLSLKPRQQDDPAILNGFRAMFTGEL